VLVAGMMVICAGNVAAANDDRPAELKQAAGIEAEAVKPQAANSAVTGLRRESQKQAALALGVSRGFAWRSGQIRQVLEKYQKALDRAFNFAVLMNDGITAPPVVRVQQKVFAQDDPLLLRETDQVLRIVKTARLQPGPLSWRSYFMPRETGEYQPPQVLIPTTSEERKAWEGWVSVGWKQGVKQAEAEFRTNLARAVRDYEGMLEYRKLLALGKIRSPYVASQNRGTIIDPKKRMMRIQDVVHTIADPARFQSEGDWNVILIDGD